jgi:hypothetical protein
MCDCEFIFEVCNVEFTTTPMPQSVQELADKTKFNERVKQKLIQKISDAILKHLDFNVIMNEDKSITYKARV